MFGPRGVARCHRRCNIADPKFQNLKHERFSKKDKHIKKTILTVCFISLKMTPQGTRTMRLRQTNLCFDTLVEMDINPSHVLSMLHQTLTTNINFHMNLHINLHDSVSFLVFSKHFVSNAHDAHLHLMRSDAEPPAC